MKCRIGIIERDNLLQIATVDALEPFTGGLQCVISHVVSFPSSICHNRVFSTKQFVWNRLNDGR